jgi:hypothetical protein
MDSIDAFLRQPLLEARAAAAFRRSQKQIAARHGNWRASFPAFALLLDGDEDRAHALAGNYATEARETVDAWLSERESVAAGLSSQVDEHVAWVEGYWAAWRCRVVASDGFQHLGEAPRDRFTRVFDDLMERFRTDAVVRVRAGKPRRNRTANAWAEALARPIRAFGRGLHSFFFPGGRG